MFEDEDVEEPVSSADKVAEDVKEKISMSSVDESNGENEEESFEAEQGPVPYKVFAKRNAKLREAERKLKSYEAGLEKRVEDEIFKKEAGLRSQYQDQLASMQAQYLQKDSYSYEDTVDVGQEALEQSQEVAALKAQIEKLSSKFDVVSQNSERESIKRTVEELKYEYPSLNEQHVYSLRRARPEWSWEECAEASHTEMEKHTKVLWKKFVDNKKKAAISKTIGPEGRNIKPEDKPKSFKEFREKMSHLMGD